MFDLITDPPLHIGAKRPFYGQATAPTGSTVTLSSGGSVSIYGYPTRITSAAASATQTMQDTSKFAAADVLFFHEAGVTRTVSSITNTNVLVLTSTVTTLADELISKVIVNAAALTGYDTAAGTAQKFWYDWDTASLSQGLYAMILTNAATASDSIARTYEVGHCVRLVGVGG